MRRGFALCALAAGLALTSAAAAQPVRGPACFFDSMSAADQARMLELALGREDSGEEVGRLVDADEVQRFQQICGMEMNRQGYLMAGQMLHAEASRRSSLTALARDHGLSQERVDAVWDSLSAADRRRIATLVARGGEPSAEEAAYLAGRFAPMRTALGLDPETAERLLLPYIIGRATAEWFYPAP